MNPHVHVSTSHATRSEIAGGGVNDGRLPRQSGTAGAGERTGSRCGA
jgi:hypothetical protein